MGFLRGHWYDLGLIPAAIAAAYLAMAAGMSPRSYSGLSGIPWALQS